MIQGISLPFLGTALGAGCVFFIRRMDRALERALMGFAAGVMVAATVWSLLIPAIDRAPRPGAGAVIPAAAGLWAGIGFLLLLDWVIPWLHKKSARAAKGGGKLTGTGLMVLVVVLHNLPEGMAVGAVFAGWMAGGQGQALAGALALSLGIAIQNFPEGAIISLPLGAGGMKKGRAFLCGVLSGAVEPAAAALTILAASVMVPALPYLLGFAAGAMVYVVVQELIPEMSEADTKVGTVLFAMGFTVMMALDVALG